MQSTDEPTLQLLNALLQASRDAGQGYGIAAVDVADADLARLFSDYAAQRGKLAAELEQRIRLLRGEPAKHGTAVAALHRGWMDLKAALEDGNPHAILAECERGEDLALAIYREALKMRDLDADSRRLIQSQYELVQAAHDRVRQLRDSPAYAP